MIVAIVAHDKNKIIGKGNELPWRLPEDLKLFKKHTTGCSVIMGRKTWESIPEKYRPLPNRTNIVLTRFPTAHSPLYEDKPDLATGPFFVSSWEDAITVAKSARPNKNIFVIGGASIYDYALNKASIKADRILLSCVDGEYEGDVYFPELEGKWINAHISSHDGFELIEKIRYETCIPLDNR